MASQNVVRQNFDSNCEASVNKQINLELYSSYMFTSLAYHFDRNDIALKGFSRYFKKKAAKKNEDAEMFMRYQNLRGGRIVLQDVKAPQVSWNSAVQALEDSIVLEKKLNESILTLSQLASEKGDPHLAHHLNSSLVQEQVNIISKISILVTNAKRCGDNLGLYEFDRELQE